ncbi:MAG: MazG nucleotide pyrophosphohydrolase domain-containing protein [Candidatus Woesearchaeota archaeon]
MELKESQEKVKEYFEKNNVKPWTQFAILARLEEEISEIGRIISVDEGLREEWKIDNMDRVDEFGDALFQLMHLANQMDVDLEEAMEKVLKKYSEYVKDK